ncbi:helix-turn-helix transcriptional regulator [Microbacterium sp.]|uniref:helix-turn-helix transcriptional regulator n=1 Tax=Microbacterium sp. TaxID=51671 RepID=UPI00334179DD
MKDSPDEIVREIRRLVDAQDWDGLVPLTEKYVQRVGLARPDVWPEVFAAFPREWLLAHPRQRYFAAVYQAVTGRYSVPDGEELAEYARWVESQEHPLPRDTILLEASRLQYVRLLGLFDEAPAVLERIERLTVEADDYRGLDDIMPSVYIPMGTTRLFLGDVRGAISAFAEARRWSSIGPPHPAYDHASNYLALALHLSGDPVLAASVQAPWAGRRRHPMGSYAYVYEGASLMLPAFAALARLDAEGLERAIGGFDAGIDDDELWWVAAHLRARHALYWGDPAVAAERLEHLLDEKAVMAPPRTLIRTVLLADLSDLYQAQGDLHRAVDAHREPSVEHPLAVLSRARLQMLLGDAPAARALLPVDAPDGLPRATAPGSWLALRAALDRVSDDDDADRFAVAAAAAVRRRGDLQAIMEADPRTRELIIGSGIVAKDLPDRPYAAGGFRLTDREIEVLSALRVHESVKATAEALFLSVNTVKSHLRTVYRKLGVRTREEALRRAGLQ